ncbi:MAG: gamma-glutamyltransferase [Chloroflexota bacterium]
MQPNQAAIQVLADGGNAADAAVAAAAVQWVTMPWACGVGGDAVCLVSDVRRGAPVALIGCGPSPAMISADWMTQRGHEAIPLHGPLAVGVPGAVDLVLELHARYGSRDLSALLEPSIRLARDGFTVGPHAARFGARGAAMFRGSAERLAAALPIRRGAAVGDIVRQPALARTLAGIATGRRAGFYEGAVACSMARAVAGGGGLLSAGDLGGFRAEVAEPISTSYRGVRVLETPPPTQGVVVLEMLNLMEGFPVGEAAPLAASTIHRLAGSARLAFDDRETYLVDPSVAAVPLDRLLSKQHAAERRPLVDGAPARLGRMAAGDTTSFAVADEQGSTVAFIHSLGGLWGSGVVDPETGVLLNNRVARGFSLEEADAARLVGGQRPAHTLHCFMLAEAAGSPFLAGATPGADLGAQWTAQIVLHLTDHGLSAQTAVEMPRWHLFPGAEPPHRALPAELQYESGLAEDTLASLRRLGHRTRSLGTLGTDGGMQIVGVDRALGRLVATSDPRCEAAALGV